MEKQTELKILNEKAKKILDEIKGTEPSYEEAISGGIYDKSYMVNQGLVNSYGGKVTLTMPNGDVWECTGHRCVGSPEWIAKQGWIEFTLKNKEKMGDFYGLSTHKLEELISKNAKIIDDLDLDKPSYNLALFFGIINLSSRPKDILGNFDYASYMGECIVKMANGDEWKCKGIQYNKRTDTQGRIEFRKLRQYSVRMNLPSHTEWKGDFDVLSPYPPYNTGNIIVRVKSDTLYIKDFCGYSSNPWRDESSEITIPKGIWEIIEEKGTPQMKRTTKFKEIV